MTIQTAYEAFLESEFATYRNPVFVTLLFKKGINHNRCLIRITPEECLRTFQVFQRRINKLLYDGKHKLAMFGCLEINEEQRYHYHVVIDWPLDRQALEDALRHYWSSLDWADRETHARDTCDVGAVKYVLKARTKVADWGAFDPHIMERGPSSLDLGFEGQLPSCEWQHPRISHTKALVGHSYDASCKAAADDVWRGEAPPILASMPASTSMATNRKRRLPKPKQRRRQRQFVVQRKCSRREAVSQPSTRAKRH